MRAGLAGQGMQVQRHLDDHAAIGARDGGREQRRMLQPGVTLHFRDVLVGDIERVGAVGGRLRAAFEIGDHAFAAAGIAGHRVHGQRPVGRDQPGAHQRPDQRQKAGGIAAGIGDPLRLRDRRELRRIEFGEPVGPAVRDPVRGRGVDHAGAIVVDQLDGFARSVVGQAQDDEIGVVQRRLARLGVLALCIVQRDDRDLRAIGQPFANFEAGGAGGAVDEDRNAHATINAPRST